MSITAKAVLAALGAIAACMFVAWCGGYNFDERGPGAMLLALLSGVFGAMAYSLVKM